MFFERSCLRYAHTTGYTSLIYAKISSSREFLLSCGSDGDVRKWQSIDDDDPSSNCLGEFVICIAQQGDRLLASTDRNTVQAYTLPDIENDGVLLRFTAPVTCLRATKSYIVAGSEDTCIKVQKKEDDKEAIIIEITGHSGPVLGVDINERAGVIASIAGDGKLKIWQLESGMELKSFDGLPKVNSFESASCYGTPCFEPRKQQLLAYARDNEIRVLDTTNWELLYALRDEAVSGNYTCCQFSQDGQMLAAGTTSGDLSVFNMVNKKALKCKAASSECQAITSLAWKLNSSKELSYCDASGQLGTLFASGNASNSTNKVSVADGAMDFGDIEFEDEQDGDDANDLINMHAAEDNDLMDDGDLDVDDDGEDDENADVVSLEKLKRKVMQGVNGEAISVAGDDDAATRDSMGSGSHVPPMPIVKTFKQQAAFQPGSTPSKLEHYYLVWNNVGIVTAHADDADGAIDVEFHDASVHHALHITNYAGHEMASLSNSVLALGAHDSTKLVCIALEASGNREWSVQFPNCESTEAVAASTKFVAVVTSSQLLRIFTVLGTQREIVSLPGPVVSMAAYEDRLIVVYHAAPSSEKQQNLAAMLLQFKGMALRSQFLPLPLLPERQMTWLGFSDCGSPSFADSMGLVQLFCLKSNCWYPICDTLKESQSVSNNYFIIAVLERQQIIQAVLCRGTSYPMTNPRPMMQELSMRLPLCDAEAEKSDLEDALIRASFMSMDNAEKTIKETAIKLFALACRSDLEQRAKELIETIASPEILTLAVKYATKLGRIHLSDRLYELLPSMETQDKDTFDAIDQSPAVTQIVQQNNVGTIPNGGIASARLAPKPMELNNVKRASLKRFSLSSSSSSSGAAASASSVMNRKGSIDTRECLNSESLLHEETQENIYSEKSSMGTELLAKEHNSSSSSSSLPRTPFNSVNPFAAKRKLADVDFGSKGDGGSGIIMGANKLKIAKK